MLTQDVVVVARGAPSDVLRTIESLLAAGRSEWSYLDLAIQSGYSQTAVVQAVRVLQERGVLVVERQRHGRANRYALAGVSYVLA